DRAPVELEAPVRLAAFRFVPPLLLGGEIERRPVVDRRQAAGAGAHALAVELVLGLVGGVEAAGRDQPVAGGIVERRALRLPYEACRRDAEPGEILHDAARVLLGRAGRVRVI